LNTKVYDEILQIRHEDAGGDSATACETGRHSAGISAGGNVWAALEVAKRQESKGKTNRDRDFDTGERISLHMALSGVCGMTLKNIGTLK